MLLTLAMMNPRYARN